MPHLSVNGAKLYYEEAGEGRPVVFLHGLWMSTRFFDRQLPFFSERFRTIAVDFRGHGRSEQILSGHTVPQYARDIHGLLEARGAEGAVIVGWSMGSLVAWDYVEQFGVDGLGGTVVVDQPASDYTRPDWPNGILDFDSLHHFMDGVQTDWDATVRGFVPMMLKEPPSQAELEWMAREILRIPPAIASAILYDQTVQDYRATLPEVTVPTLVCRGAAGFLNAEAAALAVELMPDARLTVFEQSGHCAFLEEPDRFNDEVARFIESLV